MLKKFAWVAVVCFFTGSSVASADTVWSVSGGSSTIQLDRERLALLGISVELPDRSFQPLPESETGELIELAADSTSSLALTESRGVIVGLPLGSLRHTTDIVIQYHDTAITISGFRIVPVEQNGAVRFDILDSAEKSVGGPMLHLQHAKFGFDRINNQFLIESPAVTIGEALAAALGADKLAGESIGELQASFPAVWAGGDPEGEPSDVINDTPMGGDGAPRGVPCSGITGPDVVIGDFHEEFNITSEQVGGVWIDAFSVGTYSCNIGDVNLQWNQAPATTHPVIGQNFYRFYTAADGATRFEQLGQSWLKHGFFALQNDLCCDCGGGGAGNALGVGCSDPYAASRNAGQSGAGPKWQVNPSTGVHIHPISNPSGYPANVGRRLQIRVDELNEPGALYFVEGQYVAADDAAAGNKDNNASYRQILVSGTGNNRSFTRTGVTQRGEAGIRAWKDHDPSVTETDIQIPSDGLVILAAKATNIGGGLYHYEYAVENLNSNRGIRSFSIPVDPTATVSSIGFRDVPYHSNDGEGGVNRDGTDWAGTFSGGTVTWTMNDIGANSNALLWGTTYNFRFNCNKAPTAANATLGIFRSGSPSSISAATVGPNAGPQDCQPNGVEDSIDIANGTSRDCNNDGVPDECQSFTPCALAMNPVVTGFSQPVGVYAPPGDMSRLFVVEQTGAIRIVNLPAYTVNATAYLNLSGLISTGGERGLLGLAFHPDWATNGYFFVNYTNTSGNTVIARYQATGANPAANTANAGSAVILKTIAQDFANHNGGQLQFGPDEMLYCGMGDGGNANDPNNRSQADGSLLGKMLRLDVDNPPTYIPTDNPFVGPGDPLDEIWAKGLRNPWRFSFDRLTGDLWIADVGQDAREEINFVPAGTGAGANFGWRCMEGNVCTGLSGCTCNAPSLTLPIRTESHGDGQGTGSITGGYVYRGCELPWLNGSYFYADFEGDYVKRFRYNGSVTDLETIQAPGGAVGSIVSFGEDANGELYVVSILGTIYKIECAAPPDLCGNGDLDPGEECDDGNDLPGDGCFGCQFENNDDCDDAIPIGQGVTPFDTTAATTDGPAHPGTCTVSGDGGQTYNDVWFSYQSPCDGNLTVSTCEQVGGSATYDTDMVLYSWDGTSCASRTFIACNDDDGGHACGGSSGGYHSTIVAPVSAGQHYLIRVGGWNSGNAGTGNLFVSNSGFPCGVCGNGIIEGGEDCDPPGPFCNANCFFSNGDCNGNNIDDGQDIAEGNSFDCNGNDTPDECESTGGATKTYPISGPGLPLAIPDGTGANAPGAVAAHEFTVPDNGTIQDVNVNLVINHSWNGDLIVRLKHGATTVVLIDRPGQAAGETGAGNNDDGYNCTLDDEATSLIENANPSGQAVVTGTWRPNGLLSAFDGQDKAGVWRLEITDNFNGDTGALVSWGLVIQNAPNPIPPCDCNNNGITDSVDISSGASTDCNSNGLPDECDIAGGAVDCDGGPTGDPAQGDITINTFCFGCHGPDGFGVDCGGGSCPGPVLRNKSRITISNKLLPPTDHPGGAFPGFTPQTFADLEAFLNDTGHPPARPDGILDSCQSLPDCDGDGIKDGCEFGAGTAADVNFDGIPDNCQTILTGACCTGEGCAILTALDCSTAGGAYQGDNSACTPNPCPPVNDDCENAIPIGDGSTAYSTVNATTDGPAEPGACTKFSDSQVNQDVWFIYTATCTGELTLSTCNAAGYDTKIAIYEGITCPSSSGAMGCRDDWSGCSGNTTLLTVPVVEGNSYLVRVGGYSTAFGTGTLTLTCNAFECTNAGQCDDSDPCTADSCVDNVCVNTLIDSDTDGTPDCSDGCPNDSLKTEPGQCGCGNADTDSDADGTADCNDGCPADPEKSAPGNCGCGNPETAATGDMDGLNGLDGEDLQLFVDAILGSSTDPADLCPGDFSENGVMDVADVAGMVNALLAIP